MMHKHVPPSSHILAADIGGSHITVGICDLHARRILPGSIIRMDVDGKGAADTILTSWATAFTTVINNNPGLTIAGLSMAMPGPFDYTSGILFITGLDKYEALYGKDIKNHFAAGLNIDPALIRFRNDAESTIAGEIWVGAGKGYRRVMGVTLGTGFGSAFSENQTTTDINLGSDFYRDSIADDYFSTRWFVKRYHEITGDLLTGGVKQLASMETGSPVTGDIFNEYAINLAGFLSAPIAKYRPDVLILCGNIARASRLFLPQLQQHLGELPVRLAQLDEEAPLIGAAALFEQEIAPGQFDPLNQL